MIFVQDIYIMLITRKLGLLIKPTINLTKKRGKSTTVRTNSILGISPEITEITTAIHLRSSTI